MEQEKVEICHIRDDQVVRVRSTGDTYFMSRTWEETVYIVGSDFEVANSKGAYCLTENLGSALVG